MLASWALPRYLPLAPADNRIAVRTEDHPIDYLTFEGEIPPGQYGAGKMQVHDAGTYAVIKWDERKVEVELLGKRISGRYALFPLARSDEPVGSDWMIHRMDPPLDPSAQPMPSGVAPMLACAGDLPGSDGWAFEVKWDGVRALVRSEPGRLTLTARSGNDVTARYPEIAAINRALHEHAALIDGEIVAFGADGRPSFQALQRRMHVENEARVKRLARDLPVTFIAFDLLWLDGHSLMAAPYSERRKRLDGLALSGARWQAPDTHDDGGELLAAAERLGLEGVVAKRRGSAYEPGRRSSAWIKVKPGRSADLVIGGWTAGEGARSGRLGAVLVGEYDDAGQLRYAGRVGSGFTDDGLDDLVRQLEPIAADVSPFAPIEGQSATPPGARWVHPQLTCEVSFTERSQAGILRHPVWRGLRESSPRLLIKEECDVRGKGRTGIAIADGRDIAVTNLAKLMYPAAGFTKRDVLSYYAAIAPVMAPHLAGRALTMKRFPAGTEGQAFFEKRAPAHRPEWVRTKAVEMGRDSIEFVIADDAATLVWLAQLAALELHPSLALATQPAVPTAVVFDLDPGEPASIVECCAVALLLRGMLEGLGLTSFVKTSGSKGLQLYLPLNRPDASFDATKAFAKVVAELLAREEPSLVVATQAITARKGRVLIDWAQNDRARTTVGAYSLRARPQPTVSTPLSWDEVAQCVTSGDAQQLSFTAPRVLERVVEQGDLMAPVLSLSQVLPAA